MKVWKKVVLFYLGGSIYMFLEFLWRRRSHGSMFLLGGTCFGLLGAISRLRLPLYLKTVVGTAGITAMELLSGLAVNRDYRIWDYRSLPMNFHGQICAVYSLLWLPLSSAGILLHRLVERKIDALTFSRDALQ